MSNKRTDISSCRELIQDLIRDGYRQEEILSRVNTQVDAQNQRAISLRTLQQFIKENLSLDKPDLDGVRELVQTLIHEGSRQSDILGSVNEQLSANNQRTISLSTLKRNIRDWGFSQKTNQTGTNSLRELVQTRLANGDTTREILEHVNTQRIARNAITMRTLQRRLKDWGLDRKSQHARILQESDEYILELLAQDVPVATIRRSMNEAIEEQGLPPISEPYALRKIRYQYGMKRRCRTEEERLSVLQRGLEFMESDLQRSSAILNYGRETLSHYVRQEGQVLVPRNPLYNIYRVLYPDVVQRRSPGNFTFRGNFRVVGAEFFLVPRRV
ncbi:hypothetical protein E4U25_001956 [Claviceps purpurea]|nr:hypothetical protein E4U25_001956 [Claviceps purpurea]